MLIQTDKTAFEKQQDSLHSRVEPGSTCAVCKVICKRYWKGKQAIPNLLIQWHVSVDVRVLKLQRSLELRQ